MVFKLKLPMKIFGAVFLGVLIGFPLWQFADSAAKHIPIKYAIMASTIVYLIILFLFITFEEYYELKKNSIVIKKGRKQQEIKLSDIKFININSFERRKRGMHYQYNVLHNTAYLVTRDRVIKISTSLKNKRNANLVRVLNKKYHKKINYDSLKKIRIET